MAKILKIASALGIALILFLLVVLCPAYQRIQGGDLRRFLISEVEKRTQLKVNVGEAELEMGSVAGISFRDFVLWDQEGAPPAMAASRIAIRLALLPLLERRVVFNEVRFYQPTLRVSRDEEGKIVLPDWLVHLPFQQGKDASFDLDLRELKLDNGELLFLDRGQGGNAVTRVRDIDLSLKRLGPREPPAGAATQAPSEGAGALGFSIKAALERDGQHARFASNGKVLFKESGFDLGSAFVDAELQAEPLPAALVAVYAARFFPLSPRGTLGPRLRWQGILSERVQIKGTVGFKQLEIEAPALFAGPVTPGNGQIELEIEMLPKETRLRSFQFRSQQISLTGQGSLRLTGSDPYVELRWSFPFQPWASARRYLPLKAMNSPAWEYAARAIERGEMRADAAVEGPLSEIRRLFEPDSAARLRLDAEIKEAGARLTGDRYLPVRDMSGRLTLENGVLTFKEFRASYGLSRLSLVEGSYRTSPKGRGQLELRARGETDLAELREQLKLGILPAAFQKAAANLQELGGKGRFGVVYRQESGGPASVEGQIAMENARLRLGDFALAQVKGDLLFSPREMRLDRASGQLAGSPLQVRGAVTQLSSDRPAFDFEIESSGLRAGALSRLLLGVGSMQDPGTVRGRVRYQGFLAAPEQRRLAGALELSGVQPPLHIFSQPPREVSGRVRFDAKGVDFQALRGRLLGSAFEFDGAWRNAEKPQLQFTLAAPEMDLGHLLSQMDAGSSDWYDRLQAKGRVVLGRGRYEGFEFTDLKADLLLDNRHWRLENFSAGSTGGSVNGAGSFYDDPDGLRFSVEPKVQGVPLRGFLGWFDLGTSELSGKVHLAGRLESAGRTGPERKRNLNGAFRLQIEDGVAKRFRVLVQILNLLDLSRWFTLKMPDINTEGIRFRAITGDFKVAKGVYTTQNLFVDSDDLRITGAGRIDGRRGDVDFVVAVRPFPRLDSAVSFIPLIGSGIAAIKNSLLVASFRVSGPIDHPSVTPAPLSTLGEFFFSALAIPKSIIALPGETKP